MLYLQRRGIFFKCICQLTHLKDVPIHWIKSINKLDCLYGLLLFLRRENIFVHLLSLWRHIIGNKSASTSSTSKILFCSYFINMINGFFVFRWYWSTLIKIYNIQMIIGMIPFSLKNMWHYFTQCIIIFRISVTY